MNPPTLFNNDLTPNQDYIKLQDKINKLPAGEYRKEYTMLKAKLIEIIKRNSFTKSEAARIADNILKPYIEHPYQEQPTDGGLYNIFALRDNMFGYELSDRAFYLTHWN